jgi:hypothetical protein
MRALRIALAAGLVAMQCVTAEVVPSSRRIVWLPGVPGGIPSSAVTVLAADHGLVMDSTVDNSPALKRAIAAAGSAGVVSIPAGTFRIDSSLVIGSSVVLRGAGSTQTRLLFAIAGTEPCIDIVTYGRGTWTAVESGATHGSTRVVVADASSFQAGGFVEIQQENDSLLMYTDTAWIQSWSEYSVGQVLVVERVAGDTLVLRTPLYMSYKAAMNPQIRSQRLVQRAGVERLFIRKTVATADGPTVSFKNAAYCWVREVESDHTRTAHVTANTAFACEVRDSYFHHSYDYGGGGHGYGVTLGLHTTDCLTENNIFQHLRHAMMVQVGASGNVFGYNYSLQNVQGTGETNLNQGWTPCDISLHGHYPNYNLFEGNVVQEIDVADYGGPCGPGNAFLRNRVVSEGIEVFDQSHGQNLVGNVSGSGTSGLRIEAGVDSTLVHGNRVDGAVQWDAGIADHQIPVSYYLSARPAFWTSLLWPPLGADLADTGTIPAQVRFEQGVYVSAVKAPVGHPAGRSPSRAMQARRVLLDGRSAAVDRQAAATEAAGARVVKEGDGDAAHTTVVKPKGGIR